MKIYVEFSDGACITYTGTTEEEAMCDAVYRADEHDTKITYYTEVIE